MTFRAAAVCWCVRNVESEDAYFEHLAELVMDAASKGANLIVLPELHVLELLALFPDADEREAPNLLADFSERLEESLQALSLQTDAIIIGGSHFKHFGKGIANVCAVGIPGKPLRFSAKNNLTVYERDIWELEEGSGLLQPTDPLGVLVCYDCEFPAAARSLAEAGAWVLCVPSWTETIFGFQRVRWSCLARALENQAYVVQSALVGGLGREPVPDSVGSAAIIAPPGVPFSAEEVVIETVMNQESTVVASLSLDRIVASRNSGETTNWSDRDRGDWTVHPA